MASGRGNLAPPPGLDLRDGKIQNLCVNRFRAFFLSELVLHYTREEHRLGPLSQVGRQMVVDELPTVVAVQAQQRKGQALLQLGNLLERAGAAAWK